MICECDENRSPSLVSSPSPIEERINNAIWFDKVCVALEILNTSSYWCTGSMSAQYVHIHTSLYQLYRIVLFIYIILHKYIYGRDLVLVPIHGQTYTNQPYCLDSLILF